MRKLRILAPTRYPWRFNSPRHSRHIISNRDFLPLNRLNYRIEGVTVFNPLPLQRFDLIHAFNRIPLGGCPYIIGFESHLPRAYDWEKTAYFRALQRSLAGPRCRGIIAISKHAQAIFRQMHAGSPYAQALMDKLVVRYPNVETDPDERDPLADEPEGGPIRVTFIGAHFARKGGCVAVRLAELAREQGVPLEVTIVSALEMGGGIWTDPRREAYFDDWRARLDHPAIAVLRGLPNAQVLTLLAKSHFSLLTTFSDTFGYSAVESMVNFCPVIATRQGALPEFITDGESGVLLNLDTTAVGEWVHSNAEDRDTEAYERLFTDEIERLARETLARIKGLAADPAAYRAMRAAARAAVAAQFNAKEANAYWDDFYDRAADAA